MPLYSSPAIFLGPYLRTSLVVRDEMFSDLTVSRYFHNDAEDSYTRFMNGTSQAMITAREMDTANSVANASSSNWFDMSIIVRCVHLMY